MRSKSADLFQKERILCWIMTSPDNHKKRAMAVKNTWGKRCNVLLFMSSEEGITSFSPPQISWTWFAQLKIDPSLPTIKLPIIEGRDQLWGKTREAFRHIWNHYRDQADWFFKADDDTYEIPIIFALSKNSLNEISFAGTPFWKICAIFFRLTTHRNPCGLDTNSRPSLNKATLAVAQVTSQLK